MIQPIIESLSSAVESLNLLQTIYPLCEQKESEGKTVIVSYQGKGQFKTAFNIDNFNGVGYFRKTSDTTIVKKLNPLRGCSDQQSVKYQLRFFASIRRDQLPTDCAFSDDELGWMIAKELTGKNGTIKQALGANYLYIQATKISTDRKNILSQELPGDKIVDINYNLSLVAIDFEIDIDIEKSCIASICDSYYTVAQTPVIYLCDYASTAVRTNIGLDNCTLLSIRIGGVLYSTPAILFSNFTGIVGFVEGLLVALGKTFTSVTTSIAQNNFIIRIYGTAIEFESYTFQLAGDVDTTEILFNQSNCVQDA